jgi:single-stranded-DNA-specific exonuclease
MLCQWILPGPVPETINDNLDSFSIPFRSILYRRGCQTAQDAVSLLLPKPPSFPDELSLGHVDLAARLIKSSLDKDLAIGVYGDYDTDGITATALLTLALNKISTRVIPFIPNRLSDGYGLNKSSIDLLHEQGVELLITVDNGIRSNSEVAYAKSLGMNVIITDHHQPSDPLPGADAIINAKLPGDPYPNKHLSGVGVAFKLACGLSHYYPEIIPDEYLDLVALGTIADIVPLLGENRYLVKGGLIQINQHRRQSLFSLLGAAGLSDRKITASDISFQVAPRINSSGRLSDTDHLVPLVLLLSEDPAACGKHAQLLEIHNLRRKHISRKMEERIETQFAHKDPLPPILISLEPENDLGVAGITAGYLTNKYYLPSIVGAINQETTTASCRSIPEFDIISALERNKDLFTHFGGHKLAAGFTIDNQNIPLFLQRMVGLAESELSGHDLRPSIDIDAIVTLSELDQSLHSELKKLEPTGEGNPTPVFAARDVTAQNVSTVGNSGEHLKLIVSDGTNAMPAIAFGLGAISNSMPGKFNLAFYFSENEYRGRKEFQLQVLDLQPN